MKNTIKSLVVAFMAIVACVVSGCKNLPTNEKMYEVSYTIGKAGGYAVELSKTKQEVKDGIVLVLDTLVATVPASNETFVVKWMPIAEVEIAKLVEEGKVTKEEGTVIGHAVYVACEGIDLVFIRYPEAKQYKELVGSAVDGFVAGFKSVINMNAFAVSSDVDLEAYEYLKMKAIVGRPAK